MPKDTGRPRREHYRLWQHEVRRPAKSSGTVIAKIAGDAAAPPGRAPASAMTAGGRAARSAGITEESGLARLFDNGHVTSITNVFDEPVDGGGRSFAMFAAGGGRRASRARSPRLVELKVKKGTSAAALAAHVSRMQEVEYAFVPPVRTLFAKRRKSGPDPLASRQWGHGAIRLGHARAKAGFNNAATITIAVVDSGIDRGHPDLKDAIAGYHNFIEGSDKDFVGHGTHVSGIIAATTGNALGISGVCGGKILALKALPRDGEEFDAAAYYRALRYVIGRAQVLNLSLGGEKDPAEIDVLRDVIASGVVVIAAMGNEYEEGNPVEYPAAIREVCAVGATDELDKRAGFSNTGRHIDLVAPGVGILSTTPTYRYDEGERDYDSWDGTSMATPYVSGVAALILAKQPGLTPAQVIKKLTSSADRASGAKKGSAAYGGGRLNCERALR
jgi:subtilisin family serine protease